MDQEAVNLVITDLRNSLNESGIKIENLVLFGSHVSGTAREESDIDLIIVSNDFKGKDLFDRCNMTLAAEMKTRKRFLVSMDILTMTPEEYRQSLAGRFFQSKIVV
ncbi:MAG: nucleotidyltransferase domain-containing protein [Bacteroidetes bacterium]|nr:nucleotidyltransferase domain-containing protein [Bacteroidota bacterium]